MISKIKDGLCIDCIILGSLEERKAVYDQIAAVREKKIKINPRYTNIKTETGYKNN